MKTLKTPSPTKPAGEPHIWTFAEIEAAFGDRAYSVPCGYGVHIKAVCYYVPEVNDWPAYFDVVPNWADRIGHYDRCDRSIDELIRRISAKFPTENQWQYNSESSIIEQA